MQEDQPRTQQLQRRQCGGQGEADQWPDGPRQLCCSHMAGPRPRGCLFGDVRPRCRDSSTDRQAGHDERQEQHGEVHRERGDEHTDHVQQQVVGVDRLAAVPVTQWPADCCADGRTKGVGAQRGEKPDREVADPELVLPESEARGDRDDRAGLDVIGHGHGDGRFPSRGLLGPQFHGYSLWGESCAG